METSLKKEDDLQGVDGQRLLYNKLQRIHKIYKSYLKKGHISTPFYLQLL